jgi:ubiquinone biosynthesis protein
LNITKISKIGKTYKHIGRYRQIVSILVKYGFGDILQKLKITKYLEIGKSIFLNRESSGKELCTEIRIRKVLEELGPAFIKLGQIMSTRPDLVPSDLIIELRKLQDNVPSFPGEIAVNIIEEESNKKLKDIFSEFENIPIASASIAQVHFAKLLNGEEVVIKVQRPDIKKIIEIDLEIMQHLASLLEKYFDEMEFIKPVAIVETFARSIEKEMDFNKELSNIKRFTANLSEDETIYIPKVFDDLSTGKILVMEHVKGIGLNELKDLSQQDINFIVESGAKLILKQIFEFGFFHADPHPGNILVMNDKRICFLDYGMMGSLSEKSKEYLGDLLIGIVNKDTNLIMKSIIHLSYSTELKEKDVFERDVVDLLDDFMYKKINEIDISKLIQRFLNVLVIHKIKIKPDFYLLFKTILTIEGVGRGLNPEFNIIGYLEPFTIKIVSEKYNIKKILDNTKTTLFEFVSLIKDFPENANNIISKLKSGKFRIEYEHRGLDELFLNLRRSMDHLTVAIIIMSVYVSSSLIILSKLPPLWNEIPVLGLIGIFIATVMSVMLLLSLFRGKKN